MKKVDIVISGKTYSINCPVDEVDELNAASSYIDEFIQDLRSQAPQLSYENLLVLCCLNLYEKIHAKENQDKLMAADTEQAETLLNKIIADAHRIIEQE